MGLRIATNIASLSAQRNMNRATEALTRNFERLSTGKRIARAQDDAAGLGISARLRAQVRSLDQAARNAQDGLSLLQTAESGVAEIEESLLRMRELAVQAQNGTLSSNDRANLQLEFQQLQSAITQVANGVEFNNVALLNTSSTAITLQVGPDTTATVDTLVFSLTSVLSTDLSLPTASTFISSAASATTAVGLIDSAIETITGQRGTFGALQNRLEGTISAIRARSENLSAANSRILDVDIAHETAMLTRNSILQQSAISVLSQANAQPQVALELLG